MTMTYAIATASGQIKFLTESNQFALAPNPRIITFTNKRKAQAHRRTLSIDIETLVIIFSAKQA